MPPSTSPTSLPRSEPADPWALSALDGFYRVHARVYDWTRPFLLFGRRQALRALALRPRDRVLDVGCGTGWSLPQLRAFGAEPVGVECSAPMRREAARRLERCGLSDVVTLDPLPYGSHDRYAGSADAILFSYSLSMIPPFDTVLDRAERDLREGGRIAVVDFLDARGPVAFGLRRSHVYLGLERLDALCRRFPSHTVAIRSLGFWRFYLFFARL
jgi:S-adenosylmethionine-diacylgycerolhomoserine-N-methlytransferase